GILAPVLLVALRLLQGLGSGAEFAGSFVMVAEFAPANRRGYWASLPGTGVYGGITLATTVGLTVFRRRSRRRSRPTTSCSPAPTHPRVRRGACGAPTTNSAP